MISEIIDTTIASRVENKSPLGGLVYLYHILPILLLEIVTVPIVSSLQNIKLNLAL